MKKQYFENEEELKDLIINISSKINENKYETTFEIDLSNALYFAKEKGYIKKPQLEKAREVYQHLEKTQDSAGYPIHPDIVDYVKLLEKTLEEKEGK